VRNHGKLSGKFLLSLKKSHFISATKRKTPNSTTLTNLESLEIWDRRRQADRGISKGEDVLRERYPEERGKRKSRWRGLPSLRGY